jgi:hypothetical protein
MSSAANVYRSAPLPRVAEGCVEETGRYFLAQASDPGPCFELFRRAFVDDNQHAWEVIVRIYGGLVAGWVSKHPESLRYSAETQDYVNRSFARFWVAVHKAKFERFRDLRAVLAYLKMCVHSAVVEDARRVSLLNCAVTLDEAPPGLESDMPAPAEAATERVVLTHEARNAVRDVVNARLQSDKERLVVHCLFELDLKPKAIYALHPEVFADVREIYVIRQVVLERLSRDPVLKSLASEED